jgi:membrane protease YdiL (CAAX protease family)
VATATDTGLAPGAERVRLDTGVRQLVARHPIVWSLVGLAVVMFGLGFVVFTVVGLVSAVVGIDRSKVPVVTDVVAKPIIGLAFVFILRYLGLATLAGFNRPAQWKQTWLIWLPCALIGLNLVNLIGADLAPDPDVSLIATGSLRGLANAFFEETTYRGFVLAVMLNRYHSTRAQVIGSIVFSSALFSFIVHGPNDPNWETNVAQWLAAFFAGVGFSGVLLRTRSIWLLMTVHALIILAGVWTGGLTMQQAATDSSVLLNAILSTLATLPLLFYGLYLVRDIRSLNLKSSS